MATTTSQYETDPRPSTETDRRHLLSQSQATSLYSGDQTPRAHSPPPSYENTQEARRATIADQPYRGFPSRTAYLAALNEWAESKKYESRPTDIIGYYGQTTMEEIASRPRVEFGLSKKWRERKAKKEARRASAI